MKTIELILSATLGCLVGCSPAGSAQSSTTEHPDDDTHSGASTSEAAESANVRECGLGDCENQLWPRVVVTLSSSTWSTDEISVTATTDSGAEFELPEQPCPDFGGVVCTYTYFASPSDRWVNIVARGRDVEVEQRIELAPFNRCAKEISFVTLSGQEESLSFGDVSLISPCNRL